MQIFVESWKPVLRHYSGAMSLGFEGVQNIGKGQTKRYESNGRTLFIHCLEIQPVIESDLQAWIDPVNGDVHEGRRSPAHGDWWIPIKGSAFANVDCGTGSERVYVRISQLKKPRSLECPATHC